MSERCGGPMAQSRRQSKHRSARSLGLSWPVANVYRENVDSSPVKAVHLTLGYNSERPTARRVALAREAGLLPKTRPGKRRA